MEIRDLVARAHRAARDADIQRIKTFRGKRALVIGEPWHGPVQFLEPTDAHELYRLVHRWRVLLLSFTSIYVRKDPRRQPVERRAALELGTFVEHKAEFELVRSRAALEAVFEGFHNVGSGLSCTGDDDPRCLPLHVFSVDRVWSALSEQHGRDVFADLHGPARSRVDRDKKRWARAGRRAYHGGDALTVSGQDLLPGMHWDVTTERGPVQLATSSQVWEVPRGAQGYVNVYPDAYVRSTNRSRARRVWPAKKRRTDS